MKLIDLLVQELPKRGGWPQNVTHIGQDYDRELMFYGRGRAMTGIFLDELATDHRKCGGNDAKITQDQYESALAASQKPAWNGEGVPPVGCECEFISNDTSWGVVRVIGMDDDKVVIKPSGEIYYGITPSNRQVFRPLRTEAESKRDAAVEAMQRAADDGNNWIYSEYEIIYDAIAAGKIPGVKLDD